MILVPTRELAEQVTDQLRKLTKYCEEVSIANLADSGTNHLNRWVFAYVTARLVYLPLLVQDAVE